MERHPPIPTACALAWILFSSLTGFAAAPEHVIIFSNSTGIWRPSGLLPNRRHA